MEGLVLRLLTTTSLGTIHIFHTVTMKFFSLVAALSESLFMFESLTCVTKMI